MPANLFKWVGIIVPTHWYLWSLRSRNLHITSLEDAKKYQIGAVNEDIGEQFLLSQGFVQGRNLQSSNRYELNYEKLKLGRVDLWIMSELGAAHTVRQAGDDPAKTVDKALYLKEISGGMEMAFGVKTSDAVVERFRAGLEAIKKNGKYEAIQARWR